MLDVACGSGPLADRVGGWIGLDASTAELTAAARVDRGPLLRANAERLPFATGSSGAVACAMGLQIIQPLSAAVAELARVLRVGGRAVWLLPASGPLPLRDTLLYLRVQAALRSRISSPNDRALARAQVALTAAGCGLRVVSDARRAFSLLIGAVADVDELVRSLYLPGASERQRHRAARILRGRVGRELVIPLRRVVLDRVG